MNPQTVRLITLAIVSTSILTAFDPACGADSPDVSSGSRSVGKDISQAWGTIKHTIASPFHWGSSDFTRFGIWTGAAVGCLLVEEDARDSIKRDPGTEESDLERIGYRYGAPGFTVPVSLATYVAGVALGSENIRDTGMMLFEHMFIVGVIQQPLRFVVGRARPLAEEGNLTFSPLESSNHYASFISGHTWSAVGFSVILSRKIDRPVVTAGLYSLALTTVVARLYADAHWLSDVVSGAALGYYSADTIWKHHHGETGQPGGLSLLPTPGGAMATYSLLF